MYSKLGLAQDYKDRLIYLSLDGRDVSNIEIGEDLSINSGN